MFLIICFGVLIICVNVILQSTVTVYSLKYLHKFNLKKQRLTFSEVLWQMAISVSFLTLLHGAQCTIWAATFYFNPNIDNLHSFQEAIYFSLITFTTVGYGDVTPITQAGKLFSGIIIILGIAIAALPAAILASGIINELKRRRESFRLEMVRAMENGFLDFGGLRYLEKVRIRIGISRAEARLVFEEVKQENRLQTQTRCPHCAHSLMIKHPPGHVHVHSVKSRD